MEDLCLVKTSLKWTLGIILTVIGFFVAGVVGLGYYNYINGIESSITNTLPGFISGVVLGSIAFVPGLILLLLAIIDVSHNAFDLRVSKILEEYDRITPSELADKTNTNEDKIEKSVGRIIEKGLIIVYFDSATGEFVTQEGRAIAERVLGIIESKRRVTLDELITETNLSLDEIKRIIIGMEKRGMFNGTYDWKTGKILSRDATKQLATAKTRCPHCGGVLTEPPLRGQEITCEFCGQKVTG